MKLIQFHRHRIAIILISLPLFITLVYTFDPSSTKYFPLCPFKALTGLYCPGCGSLRALNKMLHTDIHAAFNLNPLMVLMLPWFFWQLLRKTILPYRSTSTGFHVLHLNEGWVMFTMIIFYWLFRNIPLYPFTLLAPH
jgi:hypothetical protein